MAEEFAAEGSAELGSDEGLGQGSEGLIPEDAEVTQAAEGTEEEPSYVIRVGGKEQKVTLDEALKGYQRQADYTRKTQELAAKQQELAQAAQLYEALNRNPNETLRALAAALGVNFGQSVAAPSAEELDPIERIERQLQQMQGSEEQRRQAEIQRQQQEMAAVAAERQIRAELVDLHDLYGDFDDQAVVKYAVDHGSQNLDLALRAMLYEVDQEKRVAEQNRIIDQKRRAQVIEGGATSAPRTTAPGGNSKMTVREALHAAMASVR